MVLGRGEQPDAWYSYEGKLYPVFFGCPIGTIVAWHKDLTGTPPLTDRWAECNGQTIADKDSPYDGVTLPDLNGGARFLRGSATSGTLQASQNKAHTHTFTSGNQSASHTHDTVMGQHRHTVWAEQDAASGSAKDSARTTTGSENKLTDYTDLGTKTSGNQSASHTHSGTTDSTGETEGRPINMSVVWIIRIK
jgi:hypothetical protein